MSRQVPKHCRSYFQEGRDNFHFVEIISQVEGKCAVDLQCCRDNNLLPIFAPPPSSIIWSAGFDKKTNQNKTSSSALNTKMHYQLGEIPHLLAQNRKEQKKVERRARFGRWRRRKRRRPSLGRGLSANDARRRRRRDGLCHLNVKSCLWRGTNGLKRRRRRRKRREEEDWAIRIRVTFLVHRSCRHMTQVDISTRQCY